MKKQEVSTPPLRLELHLQGVSGTLLHMSDGHLIVRCEDMCQDISPGTVNNTRCSADRLLCQGNNLPWKLPFLYGQTRLETSTLTRSCKVKKHAHPFLEQAAREVNHVWNFCNATSYKAWNNYTGTRKWLSAFDMHALLSGSGDVF